MKIIVFQHMGETGTDAQQRVRLLTDSCIITNGKAFFVPDFADHFIATPAVIVKICRLGKHIAPRFAGRYWSEITAGAILSPTSAAIGDDRYFAFDGAAVVGDFADASGDKRKAVQAEVSVGGTTVRIDVNELTAARIDEAIARTSEFMTVKMGDLIVVCEPDSVPVRIGEHIEAAVNRHRMLRVNIK